MEGSWSLGEWQPLIYKDYYVSAIRRIKQHIENGDVYQVNYTFPFRAEFRGDTVSWFETLQASQQAMYAAYLNTGRYHILSLSPELFFRLKDAHIVCKPMKGTRKRGVMYHSDILIQKELESSEKDKAENLMIVDLIRNDLGKIAVTGSITVTKLFETERYPTVWQMTSTIEAKTHANILDIFRALFPSGSVTGAPKIQMTKIVSQLEPCPRGVYCGCVGWIGPDRQAQFNVAIRTPVVDVQENTVTCSVGGGIVWDSSPLDEYEECLTKHRFTKAVRPDFQLLETILFEGTFFLLEEHLERLEQSALFFGFPFDRKQAIEKVNEAVKTTTNRESHLKIRLLLDKKGVFRTELHTVQFSGSPVRLGIANIRIDPDDVFLYHKTTFRKIYKTARENSPEYDDVVLINNRGEITETTIANIVLQVDKTFYTPPVESGLLPGTFRQHLLRKGLIREKTLTTDDLRRAEQIWLINSVRKWYPARLLD